MMKKTISTLLAIALFTATLLALPASAQTFPDVTETTYAWALEAVEEMVEDGIIKGYTDNTFKPEKTVTKIEALVLSARILGYTHVDNAEFTELAKTLYEDVMANYETSYPGEISYLLYKDVLTEKELPYYIGGDNANVGMRRYEVAKLLTKVMGAEKDIDESATVSEYRDQSEIPADAKPFVRFVTDAGLMNGVPCPDTGVNFNPMGDVNRAQIATLLYRIRKTLAETYYFGTVKSIDTELETIMFYDTEGVENGFTIPYDAAPIIKKDGYSVDFSKISLGAKLLIVMRGGMMYAIETISRIPDETFEGIISSIVITNQRAEITVFRLSDESETFKYEIAQDATVKYEGNSGKLSDLKRLQAVKLEIKKGKVVGIEASESERTIKGIIENITLEPSLHFSVRLTNGEVEDYPVSENATAKRNNLETTIDKVLVGDKVTITLRYEQVYAVVATSSKFTTEGTIEEIVIATLPSIKIRTNNTINTFSLSRDCLYTVDGKSGTIYDLRLGANITASVDSETIVSLTTTAPATSAAIVGVIESINTNYGFFTMNVLNDDNTTKSMQVFTKRSNLKVINSADGMTKKVSDLKAGMTVSVTGLTSTGAFEATAIIIMPADK